MERLQAELRELEEQQREFVTESAERKDKDLDTMVSEDDEDLWPHCVGTPHLNIKTFRVSMLFHSRKRLHVIVTMKFLILQQ